MNRLADAIRLRLVPAILIAAGVALVTAGLISWTDPAATLPPSSSPTIVTAPPTAPPSRAPSASASPSATAPAGPSASPTALADRTATRVAIPALQVDLPVILPGGGPSAYPLCDVAMYIRELGQPGQGRATYLYAHAREGMFLPLLEQSQVNDGAAMLGMIVQVWTSDDQLFLYEISEVRRHATTLDAALAADGEELWLQTSEGPSAEYPKLQVVARPLSSGPAPDPADAHPSARPVEC